MDIGLFQKLTKFPFIHNNTFYDSAELHQNKSCVKCDQRDCFTLLSKPESSLEYICSKGYNTFLITVGDVKVILNGLIFYDNLVIPKGTKDLRKLWIHDRKSVLLFEKKIYDIEQHIRERENETTIKNFSIFHDFKTSMNIFFSCTNEIINDLPGSTFEEKLDKSNKSHQDLYRALSLITSQLRMIDILINPNSIQFGNKKLINIYQLFDKMKRLFEHLAVKKRDVNITIEREGWIRDSLCYETIEFIPLILLDNALKYSVPDSDIEIKIEMHYHSAKVIVKNIGPLVSDENKDRIFEKFYRDDTAQNFSNEGIGIGLWIAKEILEAHGSKLFYYKNPKESHKSIGLNIFSFDLGTV